MVSFTPFIKTSLNITDTLNEAAYDRKIPKEEVDFDLLGVQTLVQSSKYPEWTIINETLEKIFDEKIVRSESLHMQQEYKVKIRPYERNKLLENVQIELVSNKANSKVVATFKKGSMFPCDKNLAKLLKREINRKKLRLGFLIVHFEKELNSTLIKLANTIKCNIPLQKDVRILIAESPGAIFAIDDAIILHYAKAEKQKNNLVDGVDPEELVFEYIKPKNGINGRACNGKYITVTKPKIMYTQYKPDEETISVQETETSVKYYSKINGYVKNIAGIISISKEMSISNASFRNTGSIDTGENKDISVNIQNNDSSDDAVGSGVSIDVKELNVKGTIGSNAKVKANDLNVGEQTHRNSQLEAVENAKVHLHRGNLKAKTAQINILENGTIQADDVHVKKMLGGEIIGQRVVIEELTSNTTIIASESITIHSISGDNNKLIINPNKIDSFHKKVEALRAALKTQLAVVKEIKKQYTKNLREHKEQQDRIKVFQARITEATKNSKTPNRADMVRIKQYKNEAEKIKNEAEHIHTIDNEILVTELELEKLYEAELHAKIVHEGRYNGATQVIFMDIKTSQEYSMFPEGIYEELFFKKDGPDKKISW